MQAENFHLAMNNTFAGLDRVHARPARRLEAILLLELVGGRSRLLRDADRALALHVRVAAHRADARAGLADVAAQEQQVDHHLHVLDAGAVLGQAHAVDRDHRFDAGVFGCSAFQGGTGQAGAALQIRPRTHAPRRRTPGSHACARR